MELDDMKNIWKDKSIEAAGADKISAMIAKQSQSPIARMKRNLRMELLILIFSLGIVAAYYFIAFKSESTTCSAFCFGTPVFSATRLTISSLIIIFSFSKMLKEQTLLAFIDDKVQPRRCQDFLTLFIG